MHPSGDPFFCKPDIRFNDNWQNFDPRNNSDERYDIETHVKSSNQVDRKIRDLAELMADKDPGIYSLGQCDCRHYANGLANAAQGLSDEEKRKN